MDDYIVSIERAGARPRVLETDDNPLAVLDEIDGVLMTGGGDVDPALYGENRHPATDDAEPGRDQFELDLVRGALAADLPLLAICRGVQVLNVATGGTLVQDLAAAGFTRLPHAVPLPKDRECHGIRIEGGTKLSALLGRGSDPATTCRVNSRHHQAINQPGRGLVVTAQADDGVIEAVEKPDARFCLGVQWHPENFWQSGEFAPLFEAFVAAARARAEI
jgi:putative glutamine amidotransferase